MQTVTARPRCVLVASTTINWEAIDSVMEERGLEWKLGSEDGNISDQAALAELAGRGCYNSFVGPNGAKMGRRVTADYIRHLIEVGHGSVLEHATMTFQIWGNSRGFTHELVRHRVGTAFSQASTRFRDESKFGRVIVPALLRNDPESIEIMERHAKACQQAYDALLARAEVVLFDQGVDLDSTSRRKTARGAARAALPIGL
jgi:thymidylate synthase (FAD)